MMQNFPAVSGRPLCRHRTFAPPTPFPRRVFFFTLDPPENGEPNHEHDGHEPDGKLIHG